VNQETQGWVAARWSGLSTGLKMLLILALGMLPLGIVAVGASISSARENYVRSEAEMQAQLSASVQRFKAAIDRGAIIVRAVSPTIAQAPAGSNLCVRTLERLAEIEAAPDNYSVHDESGRVRCATPGFVPPGSSPAEFNLPAGTRQHLIIDDEGQILRFVLFDPQGRTEGAGEFPRAALAALVSASAVPGDYDIDLVQQGRIMPLREGYRAGRLTSEVLLAERVEGDLELRLRGAVTPVTAAEMMMILLPLMMLIFAALIGWWIIDRLLLKPLVRMQRAVAAYQPGDKGLALPELRSPAREIGALGEAFHGVTRTVASHEEELEAAVERQTKLVREVHHRVKNNLQVVASLLNLHARGAKNEDVASAYASIQRRVDALAVVHRNHYAELEENRGVALRSLVSELAANLRATSPTYAAHMQIRLDIEPFYVTQDVAVSVAFLVTEVVEFGMFCGASAVAITLESTAEPKVARLGIETDALRGEITCDEKLFERFDRIVTGLSRQLRSTLERDSARGLYSVKIGVVEKAER